MTHNVPIYLANVTVSLMKKHLGKPQEVQSFELKEQVVKGFNIENIKKRSASLIEKHASKYITVPKEKGFTFFFIIGKVKLLKQLGLGIND